ncbi:hypothetical protein LOZ66_006103 [Ophidiomyces ophidiicola]|nr:hypothetical protein LOZ66_006103 [Ophidiomyces ophidiicola]
MPPILTPPGAAEVMEEHNFQTVSQHPDAFNRGPVVVNLPCMKHHLVSVDLPNEGKRVGAPPSDFQPSAKLSYADITRRAIADPSSTSMPKSVSEQSAQHEDGSTHSGLHDPKLCTDNQSKKTSSRQTRMLPPIPQTPMRRSTLGSGISNNLCTISEKSTSNQEVIQPPDQQQALESICFGNQNPTERFTSTYVGYIAPPPIHLSEPSSRKTSEQSFLAQLKATFNIPEVAHPGTVGNVDSVLNSGHLKEKMHCKDASLVNDDSTKEAGCVTRAFSPRKNVPTAPDSASSLSTNKPHSDVLYSSPSSTANTLNAPQNGSSLSTPTLPTPLKNTQNTDHFPVPSHYNNEISNSGPLFQAGMAPREEVQGIILGGPALSPTRQGTYATQRLPEVVEHRGVPSMHGMICINAPIVSPTPGALEPNYAPGNWHRLSAPYSPSIYDMEPPPPQPNFGTGCRPSVPSNGIDHMTIQGEMLEKLCHQVGDLSKELGLVRAELQAQTFQLQQLTAHVNILRAQNRHAGTQETVPTPTAAFRTPPSTGIDALTYHPENTGSPIRKGIQQRQTSDSTIRLNDSRIDETYDDVSVLQKQISHVPAPIAKGSASGSENNAVSQTILCAARRNPSQPIILEEPKKSPVCTAAATSKPAEPLKNPLPPAKVSEPLNKPMIVNSGSNTHHRRTRSSQSYRASEHFDRVILPLNPNTRRNNDNNKTWQHNGLRNPTPPTRIDGTWGGTRNWYHHQAYGTDPQN